MSVIDLKSHVREVPDFPTPGIGFKDITPLLLDPAALRQSVRELAEWTAEREPDLVLGAEALAACYLGGNRFATLVRAGVVEERRPGAAARADVLFATARPPWCPFHF